MGRLRLPSVSPINLGEPSVMLKLIKLTIIAGAAMSALSLTASAQSTTGTVSMSGTVSKYVEIASGGGITLSGNSGGGVTTDGVNNSALAAVVNLRELCPSNKSRFVSGDVPFKLRSKAAHVFSLVAA